MLYVVWQFQVVKEHMPNEAATVFEKCVHEKALALSGKVGTIITTWYSTLHYTTLQHYLLNTTVGSTHDWTLLHTVEYRYY